MRLTKVIYSLFERELADFRDYRGVGAHGLDREVQLIFDDSECKYLSWVQHEHSWGSEDPGFHLEMANESFWSDDQTLVDMSSDPTWSELTGKDVSLEWCGPENDVLVISRKAARTYLFANGDFVEVSISMPDWLEQ